MSENQRWALRNAGFDWVLNNAEQVQYNQTASSTSSGQLLPTRYLGPFQKTKLKTRLGPKTAENTIFRPENDENPIVPSKILKIRYWGVKNAENLILGLKKCVMKNDVDVNLWR